MYPLWAKPNSTFDKTKIIINDYTINIAYTAISSSNSNRVIFSIDANTEISYF